MSSSAVSYTHLDVYKRQGMIVRKEIEDYLWALHKEHGYSRVWTPHIAKEDLYNTSGHAKHYLDDMFKVCLLYTSRCV